MLERGDGKQEHDSVHIGDVLKRSWHFEMHPDPTPRHLEHPWQLRMASGTMTSGLGLIQLPISAIPV